MSLEGKATAGQELKGRINAIDILTLSAYGIAVKHGFKGTEEEWLDSLSMGDAEIEQAVNAYLDAHPVAVDATLSVSSMAADAKATGDAIHEVVEAVEAVEATAYAANKEAKDAADEAMNAANTAQATADTAAAAATTAQTTADGAMPKAGGTFTGNAVAYSANRSGEALRNIEVVSGSVEEPTAVSTNKIVMVRK